MKVRFPRSTSRRPETPPPRASASSRGRGLKTRRLHGALGLTGRPGRTPPCPRSRPHEPRDWRNPGRPAQRKDAPPPRGLRSATMKVRFPRSTSRRPETPPPRASASSRGRGLKTRRLHGALGLTGRPGRTPPRPRSRPHEPWDWRVGELGDPGLGEPPAWAPGLACSSTSYPPSGSAASAGSGIGGS